MEHKQQHLNSQLDLFDLVEQIEAKEDFDAMLKQVCKDFNLVFQPSEELRKKYGRRRFLISPRMLPEYVGRKNANNAVLKAFESSDDKVSIKLRKHGKLDFYTK